MQGLFREKTPIEQYRLGDRIINVKREDLYGCWPAPPLAKLRGMRKLVNRHYDEGFRTIGCWDTRISQLGLGLAALAQQFDGMRAIVSYPTKRQTPVPPHILEAARLGADIYPVKGGRINISFSASRKYVEEIGGKMLPFGLECFDAVEAVAAEATTVPTDLLRAGTLVLSCGSGVTLAGLLRGLPLKPKRIVAVSSGRSIANIRRCILRYISEIPSAVEIHEATIPYSKPITYHCPFPSNEYYDLKAFKFLVDNFSKFRDPVLFWNIGA